MWPIVLKIVTAVAGINFGAIFNVITATGKSIIKYSLQWIIALLLITNGGTYYLWQHTDKKLISEKAAHVKTINDFKLVQTVANARAEAIRVTLEKEAKKDAIQADANYANLLDKYNASLLRYREARQGSSIRPDNYQLPTSQGGDGPSTSTELPDEVIISLTDAKICAVNTARLQAVHDWAVNLPKD